MATDAEEICNVALARIGVSKITSISDNNSRAVLCNTFYTRIRDERQRSHPWNFTMKRALLSLVTTTFVDGDVNTGTDQINIATHGLVLGDRVTFSSTGTLPAPIDTNNTYYVIFVDASNFKLAESLTDAIAGTALDLTSAAGGGTHTLNYLPLFKWDYKYNIPSDMLRALQLEQKSQEFKIEGGYIVSDTENAYLLYVAQITDTTKFDKSFDDLLAAEMAYELSYPLVQSASLKKTLFQELQLKLRDVRSFDAQEGTPDEFEADDWTNSRL
jgi:hypothetical protein